MHTLIGIKEVKKMWIDSQNKTSYINTKYLKVLSSEDSYDLSTTNIFADDICIGNYSRNRALEILKELKSMISNPDNYSYEMPLE